MVALKTNVTIVCRKSEAISCLHGYIRVSSMNILVQDRSLCRLIFLSLPGSVNILFLFRLNPWRNKIRESWHFIEDFTTR